MEGGREAQEKGYMYIYNPIDTAVQQKLTAL